MKNLYCTFALFATLFPVPLASLHGADAGPPSPIKTGVTFRSTDAVLQRVFHAAEARASGNIRPFKPGMRILLEGGGYGAAWLETQPMGGAMYAKRDVEVAVNNQIVFMTRQRPDGRLPGRIDVRNPQRSDLILQNDGWLPGAILVDSDGLLADYKTLQGHCFPQEALDVYFWMGEDRAFLQQLFDVLEKHDRYLWRVRDSNNNGCLETWAISDTGEDRSEKFGDSYHFWSYDLPPTRERIASLPEAELIRQKAGREHKEASVNRKLNSPMPVESMDVMSYSYANRITLAAISAILRNGREAYWTDQAAAVKAKIKDYLWVPTKAACFDRDRNGEILPTLVHNNLRCMHFGSFDQDMADRFVREHLLNPKHFWTPVPLPSIAANDPKFKNVPGNDWNGQAQGLTYQRAFRALENYGHHAELSMIGAKLVQTIQQNNLIFGQQFDPYTGKTENIDGYGPTVLAALEYVAHFHGVHLALAQKEVWWSGVQPTGHEFSYTQRWGEHTFALDCEAGRMRARMNGRDVFSCTAGVRVVTNLDGKVIEIVGIQPEKQRVTLNAGSRQWHLTVGPNEVWGVDGVNPKLLRSAPFDYPHLPND
jgi:hypothetical protein